MSYPMDRSVRMDEDRCRPLSASRYGRYEAEGIKYRGRGNTSMRCTSQLMVGTTIVARSLSTVGHAIRCHSFSRFSPAVHPQQQQQQPHLPQLLLSPPQQLYHRILSQTAVLDVPCGGTSVFSGVAPVASLPCVAVVAVCGSGPGVLGTIRVVVVASCSWGADVVDFGGWCSC
eukprot:scaffold2263_cov391-Prasinococcus_capsulatus_cf.AAC.5